MKIPVPVWLIAVAFSCVAIHAFPATHHWLWYRPEAIHEGQWWRLLTCHLVHFSTKHLVLNLAAFSILSFLLANQGSGSSSLAVALGALFISIGLLKYCPAMESYAGLSGIVSLLAWRFALSGFTALPRRRTFYLCVTVALTLKLMFEFASGRSLALSFENEIVTEPMAHFLGAMFSIFWVLSGAMIRSLKFLPSSRHCTQSIRLKLYGTHLQ